MKIDDTQYWVSFGKTESSDDLPVIMWDGKPTRRMVDKTYKELLPDEYSEVGFVNWSLTTLLKASP